jgi:tripartite motif-containing protein 71
VSIEAGTSHMTLKYVKTIGIVNNGYNGRGFANPYDVAVSQDGRIFVLNRCDPARAAAIRVGICTLDEVYLGEFGYGFGSGDGQLAWPVAMAFDSQERLYITDEHNHRISIFDTSGTFIGKWGVFGGR